MNRFVRLKPGPQSKLSISKERPKKPDGITKTDRCSTNAQYAEKLTLNTQTWNSVIAHAARDITASALIISTVTFILNKHNIE